MGLIRFILWIAMFHITAFAMAGEAIEKAKVPQPSPNHRILESGFSETHFGGNEGGNGGFAISCGKRGRFYFFDYFDFKRNLFADFNRYDGMDQYAIVEKVIENYKLIDAYSAANLAASYQLFLYRLDEANSRPFIPVPLPPIDKEAYGQCQFVQVISNVRNEYGAVYYSIHSDVFDTFSPIVEEMLSQIRFKCDVRPIQGEETQLRVGTSLGLESV